MTEETKAVRALMERAVRAGKDWYLLGGCGGCVRGTRRRGGALCCPVGALSTLDTHAVELHGYPPGVTFRVYTAADGKASSRLEDRSYLLSLCGLTETP